MQHINSGTNEQLWEKVVGRRLWPLDPLEPLEQEFLQHPRINRAITKRQGKV